MDDPKELERLKNYKPSIDDLKNKTTEPLQGAYLFGWICPRCLKVHNWMVQHCDCPANVITASTTEVGTDQITIK